MSVRCATYRANPGLAPWEMRLTGDGETQNPSPVGAVSCSDRSIAARRGDEHLWDEPGGLCYVPMMVSVGDVIENPVTGERITFVRTSEQTGGALAELDLELSPTAFLAAEHIHHSQEEKFQVLEGRILLRCRGEESMCGPGDTVVVPSGNPHAWAPHGGAPARVRITFTPGNGIEMFFDEFFRLAREGRVNSKGMPSLPVSARLGLAHDMYLAGPPVPLQRAAFRVLATTDRLLHGSDS